MTNVPFIAVVAAALFAVAIKNVWFTLLREERSSTPLASVEDVSNESFKKTVWAVAAYLLFFSALAQVAPLLLERFSFAEAATLVTIIFAHPHIYLAVSASRPIRYFLSHAGFAALVVFGGLAVITYWPW